MFHIAIATGGTVLVVVVWLSVLRTTLMPRGPAPWMARWTARSCVAVGTVVARRLPPRARERVLGLCVPVSLFLLAGGWLAGVLIGFALIAWAVGGTASDGMMRVLAVAAVLSAALVLCAFVVYLMHTADAYRNRERLITRSATRMHRVTDADSLLAEHVRTGSRDSLDDSFAAWADWFADVRDSHVSYPGLVYQRSVGSLCWPTAALIIMDVAALVQAAAPVWAPLHTRVLLDSGSVCLRRLAKEIGVVPLPTTVSLQGREERAFCDTMRLAMNAGLPVEFTVEDAYREFQKIRVRYAPHAVLIGSRLMISWNDDEEEPDRR